MTIVNNESRMVGTGQRTEPIPAIAMELAQRVRGLGTVEPFTGETAFIANCGYLTVAPSGGFFTSLPMNSFVNLFESCFKWAETPADIDPILSRRVVRQAASAVVARRRLEPPVIYDDDYV